MSINVTTAPHQISEIRPLSDAEVGEVNGGFVPLVVGAWLAAGFVWGMVLGDYIAEQTFSG